MACIKDFFILIPFFTICRSYPLTSLSHLTPTEAMFGKFALLCTKRVILIYYLPVLPLSFTDVRSRTIKGPFSRRARYATGPGRAI